MGLSASPNERGPVSRRRNLLVSAIGFPFSRRQNDEARVRGLRLAFRARGSGTSGLYGSSARNALGGHMYALYDKNNASFATSAEQFNLVAGASAEQRPTSTTKIYARLRRMGRIGGHLRAFAWPLTTAVVALLVACGCVRDSGFRLPRLTKDGLALCRRLHRALVEAPRTRTRRRLQRPRRSRASVTSTKP
jgi:hypothetical protein